MKQRLTISRMRSYRSCQRLHHYRYDLGARPTSQPSAARFGTLVHVGLEQWWLALVDGADGLAAALMAAQLAWSADDDADEFVLAAVHEVLRAYAARWSEQGLTAVAVEREFRVPLRNPETSRPSRTYDLAGKIDAIAVDAEGRHWVVEHKTTSLDISPGSAYWQRLRIDGQVSLYYEAAQTLGYDVAGCLYDVIARPLHKRRMATPDEDRRYTKGKGCKMCGGSAGGKRGVVRGSGEIASPGAQSAVTCPDCSGNGWREAPRLHSNQRDADETLDEYRGRVRDHIAANPDRYFQRGDVVRLESEIVESQYDVWQTASQMRDAARFQIYPRNPSACERFGRTCAFFSVCTGEASLDDESRFVVGAAHPELSSPKETAA